MVRLRTLGHLALEGPGAELAAVLRQPKTLAVLVYLLITSRDSCVRRDRLVGMFWPDLDHNRARAALRNALYVLRRALPDDTILSEGGEMLRVDRARIWIDAVEFEDAVDSDAPESALAVYRGDFMPGFHLNGTSEFEAWRDSQERMYRRAALSAATSLAAQAESDGRPTDALHWLEAAVALAPYDEEPIRRLIVSLLSRGDRGAARAAYHAHAARLRHLELTPSAETTDLLAADIDTAADEVSVPDAVVTESAAGASRRQEPLSGRSGAPGQPVIRRRGVRTRLVALVVASVGTVGLARSYFESHRAWTEGFSAFRADVANGDVFAAYDRGRTLREWLDGDREFEVLWQQVTAPASIQTSPDNATISVQDYGAPDGPWVTLGVTPLHGVQLPATYLRWRIERPATSRSSERGSTWRFAASSHSTYPTATRPPAWRTCPETR